MILARISPPWRTALLPSEAHQDGAGQRDLPRGVRSGIPALRSVLRHPGPSVSFLNNNEK